MKFSRYSSKHNLLCAALLAILAGVLFAYSVELRRPWFGKSATTPECWLTSQTLVWAKAWYREGPLHVRFGLLCDPDSIEQPTLESRQVYSSYPPGVVLPLYAAGRILHQEPSLKMAMAYGLASQFAIALLLSWMAFCLLRRSHFALLDAGLLASIPIFAVLFLPAPAYLFATAYLHDLAVLLPFVAYVGLEQLRDNTQDARTRRVIAGCQAALMFFGMLCDWLFAFAAFCTYLKRFSSGEIVPFGLLFARNARNVRKAFLLSVWNTARFTFPLALALGLFVLQLHYFDQFDVLAGRFRERSGLDQGHFLSLSLDSRFWTKHMVRGYGAIGKDLIGISIAGLFALLVWAAARRLLRKQPNPPMNAGLSVMFLLLIPCLLETIALGQHSAHPFHFFSTAKYAIPIAMIPFVVLPATLAVALSFPARWHRLLAPLLLLLAAAYVYHETQRLPAMYPPPPQLDLAGVGQFVGENTTYDDVVFTPNIALATLGPPVLLAASMKHVHLGNSIQLIHDKLKNVSGEYSVDYIVTKNELPLLDAGIQRLATVAYETKSLDNFLLYKIRKTDFLAVSAESGFR